MGIFNNLDKYTNVDISEYISGALAREARLRSTWVSKSTHPRKFGNHVTVQGIR